jgi:hypothetical protein
MAEKWDWPAGSGATRPDDAEHEDPGFRNSRWSVLNFIIGNLGTVYFCNHLLTPYRILACRSVKVLTRDDNIRRHRRRLPSL